MENCSSLSSMKKIAAALILFGLAFGFVEGAVVVDLRALYEPIHRKVHPHVGTDDLYPLVTLEELRVEGPQHVHRLGIELAREAATLVMLAAVPLAYARNFRQWIAGFMIGFGVWDLAYYLTLKILLGWPASLMTWDILFLLPLPWSGPVIAPCLVAVSIVAAGLIVLQREAIGRPILLDLRHWSAIILGGLIVVVSFCWTGRSVAAGCLPGPFPWGVFISGELLGFGVFLFQLRTASSAVRSRTRSALWIATLIGLIFLIGSTRQDQVVGIGTPIVHDDFAFTVHEVKETRSSENNPGNDGSLLLIVTLEIDNQAKRVSYRFDPLKAMIGDDQGHEHRLDPIQQSKYDVLNPARSAQVPPIPAGRKASVDLAFSISRDCAHPRLQITAGDPVGDFLEALTVGSKRIRLDP